MKMEHDLIIKSSVTIQNLRVLGDANDVYYVGAWWRSPDSRGDQEVSLATLKLLYPKLSEEELLLALEKVISHPPDWFQQHDKKGERQRGRK